MSYPCGLPRMDDRQAVGGVLIAIKDRFNYGL
jgi:hypothetical protein